MKIVCVGAGAIGLLLASRLRLAGADITLVCRTAEQAKLIETDGIRLTEPNGETIVRLAAYSADRPDRIPETSSGCPDWVLLAVKQKHITDQLLLLVKKLAGPEGRLLCFQNGIGHVERIMPYIKEDRIYLAVTTEGARKLSPNAVAHTGVGMTRIGPCADDPSQSDNFRESIGHSQQKMVDEMLNKAGFRSSMSNQMNTHVWNKLLINSVINPLTALLRIPNGELPRNEHRLELMRGLLQEGVRAAEAVGVRTADNLWEQILEVCRNTAANSSSMLQDLSAGRSTEIDWINGEIWRAAVARGVTAPTHRLIYSLVKAAEPPHERMTAD